MIESRPKGREMTSSRAPVVPAIRIEAENEWAWCGERRLDLMPKTFAVLRYLIDHAGRLITNMLGCAVRAGYFG